MPDSGKRKRDAPISYRPPRDLQAAFHRRVELSGLSVNAFITQAVFGIDPPRRARRPSVNHEAIARLLAELAAVRDQLSAIARTAGEGGADSLLLEEAVRQLGEIRAACFKALGRTP